jgi:gliding motility-associated-like protein
VSDVVTINIHPPLPTAKIVNTADTVIFSTTPAQLNLNLTGTGPWKITLSENSAAGAAAQFDVSNPVISLLPVTSTGLASFIYEIFKVEDKFGCLATSVSGSKTVVIFNQDMFEFPEGFSPNHDTHNDKFEIEGLDLNVLEAEMSIVNSAGTEVFRTSNSGGQAWTSWDGTNSRGADLPEGTYYYLLKVRFPDSSVFRKSGFVILKRY